MKEVLDPRYYTKKYFRMREQNNKGKTLNDSISGSVINTLSTSQYSSKQALKVPIPKNVAEKKKVSRKINRVSNYECILLLILVEPIKEFIGHINKVLNDKRIENFIDKAYNEPVTSNEKNIQNHFREIRIAEDILKTIQSNKINRNTESELKDVKAIVIKDNDDILKSITQVRTNLIRDILNK